MWAAIRSMLGLGDDPEVTQAKERMQRDHADPRKRVVSGLLAISYDVDPAYLVEHAKEAVTEWYGIDSREALLDRLRYYLEGTGATPAYDLFRLVFLARAGHGCGLLNEAESWAWAFEACRGAQRAYDSWAAYGSGYLEGHLTYRAQQGDDAGALAERRAAVMSRMNGEARTAWATTSLTTPIA
jgi:hypothetical protein